MGERTNQINTQTEVKMFRNGRFIVLRVIGLLLLVGLVAGGIFMAFRAGEAQGISQAPAVATAIVKAAENGEAAPIPPMTYGHSYRYSYGYPMVGHHFGFFPFGICGSILFLFLIFGLMKMVFFRGMWHRGWEGHKHGPWGRHWENGVPPMFDEWHKRAHGEAAPSDSESTKKES
jgi:hypothetical protein